MKFAFIIMGDYNSDTDHAEIHGGGAQIIGVSNLDEAMSVARKLQDSVDCIELCGAFGENGAEKIIEATEGRVPIGYVTHLPKQDELFNSVFSE